MENISKQGLYARRVFSGASWIAATILFLFSMIEYRNGQIELVYIELLGALILAMNAALYLYFGKILRASLIFFLVYLVLCTAAPYYHKTFQSLGWFMLLPVMASFFFGFRRALIANLFLTVIFYMILSHVKSASEEHLNLGSGFFNYLLLTVVVLIHEYSRYQLNLRAETQALTDPLTGIMNRRAFMRRIKEKINQSYKKGDGFALVILDVDDFKILNDTHGHKEGDDALKHVASTLSSNIRTGDMAFRIDGEEFSLILSTDYREDIAEVLTRLKSEIAQVPVKHISELTFSTGITFYCEGDTADGMMMRADRALYAAKKGSRDRHYLAVNEKRLEAI